MTELINQQELTTRLNISRPTLRNWVDKSQYTGDPFPYHEQDGMVLYDIHEVIEWKARHEGLQYKGRYAVANTDSVRYNKAKADLMELKVQRAKSEIVAYTDVAKLFNEHMLKLAQYFETLPHRMKADIGLTNTAADMLAAWLDDIRIELAKMLEEELPQIIGYGDEDIDGSEYSVDNQFRDNMD